MTRYFFILLAVLICAFGYAQNIELIPLQVGANRPTQHLRTAATQAIGDTLQLPFIDDFTTGNGFPNTNLWETGSGVVTNNTSPIDQPNVNVAILDGLDETGTAYRFLSNLQGTTESIGIGDDLFSKPIDLSTYVLGDSIGLSFFYQLGALDEVLFPDVSSFYLLKVYFKNQSGTYDLVWPTAADETNLANIQHGDPYELAFIKIEDSEYLHNGFQFRFQVFGHTSSNVDTWTIDNVVLDSNRTSGNYSDVGLSLAPEKILQPYNSMPAKHFLASPSTYLKDEVKTTVKNISLTDNLSISPGQITLVDTVSGSVLESIASAPPASLTPATSADLSYTLNKAQIETNLLALNQDRFYLENTFTITGPVNDSVLVQNDTVRQFTLLDQHYAYDDGSAEYAAGVGNSGQSFVQIALKYETYQKDTLTKVFIHFPKYGLDLSSSSINIKVWKKLAGINGATEDEVLYNFPFPITYVDTVVTGFHAYTLTTPVILETGEFYIGYEHSVDSRVYVGVDASSSSITNVYTNIKYTGWGQEFLQDNIEGNLMIRPKFGFVEDLIDAIEEYPLKPNNTAFASLSLYPNPCSTTLFASEIVDKIEVINLNGEVVHLQNKKGTTIETATLANGFYLAKLYKNGETVTKKFFVQH